MFSSLFATSERHIINLISYNELHHISRSHNIGAQNIHNYSVMWIINWNFECLILCVGVFRGKPFCNGCHFHSYQFSTVRLSPRLTFFTSHLNIFALTSPILLCYYFDILVQLERFVNIYPFSVCGSGARPPHCNQINYSTVSTKSNQLPNCWPRAHWSMEIINCRFTFILERNVRNVIPCRECHVLCSYSYAGLPWQK